MLPLIAAILVSASCTQLTFNTAEEAKKLLSRDAEWAQLASDGKDLDKILSYWSDDAIVIPQGQPIAEGKPAIRAFIAASLAIPGFRIHWVSEKPSFSADGTVAYMRATNEITVPGPTGALMTLPGRGMTVWRKDADGLWRCVVDTWNDPPAPQASAPAVKK